MFSDMYYEDEEVWRKEFIRSEKAHTTRNYIQTEDG
jgi:hypothetical protein